MEESLENVFDSLGISVATLYERGMQEYEEAKTLVIAEFEANGREHLLEPSSAEAWKKMKAAALGDGVNIFLVSSFRSIERQIEIFRRKLNNGIEIERILEVNAAPGFSEHHTGRAVDIATHDSPVLEVEFESTPAFAWLLKHGAKFGFNLSFPKDNPYGYQYEPWHWCFSGAKKSEVSILAAR